MKKNKSRILNLALSGLLAVGLAGVPASALPEGPQVVHGTANISGSGGTLNINQVTQQAIINWNGFSINAGELVQFLQPSQAAAILNRVQGVDPSLIDGVLKGDGTVVLINPNGVVIGPGGVVQTGSFIGSTLGVSDADFLAGKLRMSQGGGQELGAIVNQGKIEVKDGGFVVLTSPTIANEGLIIARAGKVDLGTGTQATVNFDGQKLISFAMDFNADGALLLSRGQTSDILSQVVNNAGVEEAGTLSNSGSIQAQSVLYQAAGDLNLPGLTRSEDIVGMTQGDANLGTHLALDGHNITIDAGGNITFDTLVAEPLNGQGGAVTLTAGDSILANEGGSGIAGDLVTLRAESGDIATPISANTVHAEALNGNVSLSLSPGLIDGNGPVSDPVIDEPIDTGGTEVLAQTTGSDGTGTLVGQNGTVVAVRAGGDVDVTSVNTMYIEQVSGHDVTLTSQTGSIVDAGDTEGADNRDIVSSGNTTLTAADFLGTVDNPLEVEVGNDLRVLARRDVDGVSGVINGIVNGEYIQDSGTSGQVVLNYANGALGIKQAQLGVFDNANTVPGDDEPGGAILPSLFFLSLIAPTDDSMWMDLLRGTLVWEDEEDEADDL